MFPSILIIDDEPSIRQSLSGLLSDEGFEISTASNGYEALKIIDKESPDLVLLDIWMPGIDGIETLKEIKKTNPFIQVIMITGHGTIETAVKSTKLGAFDFIEKPLSIDKVIVAINNALNFRRLEEQNRYLRKKTIDKHAINGTSPLIQRLKQQIATVAPTDSWILIIGENGTGKELVARTIHHLSPRSEQSLIDVNCAAIPEDVIDTELFGMEKGIRNSDGRKVRGRFELADKGTIFLDEIGDMNMATQAKLLRALQEQQFERIGGGRTIKIDVRVIASTNKDLEKEIEQKRFREDLYYRLKVIPIQVPPLRDRLDDLPVLTATFLDEYSRKHRNNTKAMNEEAVDILKSYAWPGNVRELKNLIERLVLMSDKETLEPSDIPAPYNPNAYISSGRLEADQTRLFSTDSLEDAMENFEAEFIRRKMSQHDNIIHDTARSIGVAPAYIEDKLNEK